MGAETLALTAIAASIVGAGASVATNMHNANMAEKNARTLANAQADAAKRNVTVTAQGDAPQADTSASKAAAEQAAANKAKRRYGLGKTANPGTLGGLASGLSSGTTVGKKTLGG